MVFRGSDFDRLVATRRPTSTLMPSPKATYQLATSAFLKRDYQQAITHAAALLAILPPPVGQTWAVELAPKARLAEVWRAKAATLIISASAVDWKAKRKPGDVEQDDDELLLESLWDRTTSSYRSQQTPLEPTLPPQVVQNLVLAATSLALPNGTVRARCEGYLASLSAEVMQALAEAAAQDDGERSWWMKEALAGYEDLMERYLVEVLAGGDASSAGWEAERAEARKLLEWNECLTTSRKEVSHIASSQLRQPADQHLAPSSAHLEALDRASTLEFGTHVTTSISD